MRWLRPSPSLWPRFRASSTESSDHLGHDKHDPVAGPGGRATFTVSPIASSSPVTEKPASATVLQVAPTYVLWGSSRCSGRCWRRQAPSRSWRIVSLRLRTQGAPPSGGEVLGSRRHGRVGVRLEASPPDEFAGHV